MNDPKHTNPGDVSSLDTGGMPEGPDAASAAARQEAAARAEPDAGAYVHVFPKPLEWGERTYEKLTFQWDSLTGRDHLEIENELLRRGLTLVVPEYTGDYLCGMAARAALELRSADPPQRVMLLKALPLRDFTRICKSARSFLLRGEPLPKTAGSGSESKP